MKHLFQTPKAPFLALLAIILVYLALSIPIVPQVGISFDEQTDLTIAQSYDAQAKGWLRGSSLDATNVRLPMYVSWLFFNLTDSPLYSARLVSCLLGALTLMAVFLFCHRQLSTRTGIIACLILAISPYFLAFSTVAFTEGDIFITCLASWLLYLVSGLKKEQTLAWVMGSGLCLGLLLSAKASGAALVVATTICLLLPMKNRSAQPPPPAGNFGATATTLCLGALTLVLFIIAGGYAFTDISTLKELPAAYAQLSDTAIWGHYLAAAIPWLAIIVLLFSKRNQCAGPLSSTLLVLALAAVTFFVLPPVHITNPSVLTSLLEIFLSSNTAFSWAFAGEAALLHFGAILLKSGLILGIGLWLGVVAAFCRWPQRPALGIPLIFFLFYLAFLVLKMPHAQTFYMMPLFPIAAILLADLVNFLLERSQRLTWLLIAATLLTTSLDLVRTYPYTHLNGYQWLGERYLGGRSTLGYRSIAQTPSDGLTQAFQWMRENIPPGERILHYTYADHILCQSMKHSGFINNNGFHPRYTMDQANYVMIHINALINDGRGTINPEGSTIYRYPYDRQTLAKNFTKVYSVKRPFGIEVASIWHRKHPFTLDPRGTN